MTLYIVFHLLKRRWKDDTIHCVSLFKESLKRRRKVAWKRKKSASISIRRLVRLLHQCRQRKYILGYFSAPGRSHLGSLFTTEEHTRLAHDEIDTSAAYVRLVHVRRRRLRQHTKWQRPRPCFCDFQTLNFNKLNHRWREKLVWFFSFHSYQCSSWSAWLVDLFHFWKPEFLPSEYIDTMWHLGIVARPALVTDARPGSTPVKAKCFICHPW